jgi:UDP-2,4-diacetamido-2,4,6-trideoxy-beta-L-altropyranose hydrolase
MTLRLRLVCKRDSKFLWELRNHPEARRFQFNTEEITYEGHLRWFDNSLKDQARKMYIAVDDGERVGQIRFDKISDAEAEVDVAVRPKDYGKGYGSQIILEGTRKYFSEGNVLRVIAEIKAENIGSIKAFEKAGYKRSGKNGEVLEYMAKNGEI